MADLFQGLEECVFIDDAHITEKGNQVEHLIDERIGYLEMGEEAVRSCAGWRTLASACGACTGVDQRSVAQQRDVKVPRQTRYPAGA